MSRTPSIVGALSANTPAARGFSVLSPVTRANQAVSIEPVIGEAYGLIASLPAAMQGAMSSLFFDLFDNHKLRVISRVPKTMPGRREAQKAVASSLFRWVKPNTAGGSIVGLDGEGFAAKVSGPLGNTDYLENLEFGADVSASGPMAVPTGKLRGKAFRAFLAAREGRIIPRPGRPALIVRDKLRGRGASRGVVASEIVGVLLRRRRQPAMLGFYRAWDETQAKRAPDFERAVTMALGTAEQQTKFAAEMGRNKDAYKAYVDTKKIFLSMNPGSNEEARRVAKAASDAVRRGLLSREAASYAVGGVNKGVEFRIQSRGSSLHRYFTSAIDTKTAGLRARDVVAGRVRAKSAAGARADAMVAGFRALGGRAGGRRGRASRTRRRAA